MLDGLCCFDALEWSAFRALIGLWDFFFSILVSLPKVFLEAVCLENKPWSILACPFGELISNLAKGLSLSLFFLISLSLSS